LKKNPPGSYWRARRRGRFHATGPHDDEATQEKALSLMVSQSILLRTDEVIE
jgi:hypothetical protein